MRCDILADIPINEFGEATDTSGPQVRIWIIYGIELSTFDNKVLESTGPRIRNDLGCGFGVFDFSHSYLVHTHSFLVPLIWNIVVGIAEQCPLIEQLHSSKILVASLDDEQSTITPIGVILPVHGAFDKQSYRF